MSKLTKAQKLKVQKSLLARWKTVLEEDPNTDGFCEDLSRALGHGDISEISTEASLYADSVVRATCAWLARLPEVA